MFITINSIYFHNHCCSIEYFRIMKFYHNFFWLDDLSCFPKPFQNNRSVLWFWRTPKDWDVDAFLCSGLNITFIHCNKHFDGLNIIRIFGLLCFCFFCYTVSQRSWKDSYFPYSDWLILLFHHLLHNVYPFETFYNFWICYCDE